MILFTAGKFTEKKYLLNTLPTAEILSGENARAWVSMVLYLKKWIKIKVSKLKKKKILGAV